MKEKKCTECDKNFKPSHHKNTLCSDECRKESRKKADNRASKKYYKRGGKSRTYDYWQSLKDGYYHVYYLPEEHYVGMTDCLSKRLTGHKNAGRIIEGVETIARFERAVDARWFEAMFHQRGYQGFHYN